MENSLKDVVWLGGEISIPPFSKKSKSEAGYLIRRLQLGESLSPPESKPMNNIGRNCHELRIDDKGVVWRIIILYSPAGNRYT